MRGDFERLLGKIEGAHKTIVLAVAACSAVSAVAGFLGRGLILAH